MTTPAEAIHMLDSAIAAAVSAINALPFEWARYGFMGYALAAMILLAPACAAAGVFVVQLRMAFYSDAVAHSAFAGVAIGLLMSAAGFTWADPRYTLLAVGLLVGAMITLVRRRTDLGTDTVIGVAFSAITAAGIAIITYAPRNFRTRFADYLYGDVLWLDAADLRSVFLLSTLTCAFMLFAYNRMLLMSFNEDLARSRGVVSRLYDYAFALLVAFIVATGIRLIGILLITALLVLPAATARNLARSAGNMLWFAVAVSFIAGVGGCISAFYLDAAVGASVILVGTLIFAVSLAVPKRR